MKSIFKNKLNLFLFFLLVINLIYIKNISYFNLEILKNSFNKNWIPVYSIYRPEVIESKYLLNKHRINKFNVSQKIILDIYLFLSPCIFQKFFHLEKRGNILIVSQA